MSRPARHLLALAVVLFSPLRDPAPARGDERAEAGQIAFFEKHVRPLLSEHCLDCHSGESPESELDLSSRSGMLRGGIRGPAVVPSKPEDSLLIRAVRHGELVKMPPKRKLPAASIALLARWVADGAVWPGAAAAAPADPAADSDAPAEFTAEQRSFWSFRPVVRPLPPAVDDVGWPRTPVDQFVLKRLEQARLRPAEAATRRELIRRVTFDLTGLPPQPAEVREFLADDRPAAYSRLVERLLASPRYGERWGRHWLDVARYADSNGLDENLCYGNAYRYRDYVIAAFNADKPYSRFVQEQIAGDLLGAGPDESGGPEGIVATGFLCIGPKMLAEDDPVKMQMDIVDEQLDTLGRAFMGLTLGCARCHDHKFDPIPTADYYALAGIFKSTHTMDTHTVVAKWHERPLLTAAAAAARRRQQQQVDALSAQIDERTRQAGAARRQAALRHTGDYLLAAERANRQAKSLRQLTPLGPSGQRPAGSILREAEDYDRGNVSKDTTNYGAGIGVLVNRGETPNFVEYDLTCDAPRTYRLEIRLAAASSRPCRLSINGVAAPADVAAAVTGSWFPDTQQWHVESYVTLRGGKNVLRLEHPAYFPHIDKLLLIPADPSSATAPLAPLTADFRPLAGYLAQWRKRLADASESSPPTLRKWRELSGRDETGQLRQLAAAIQRRLSLNEPDGDKPDGDKPDGDKPDGDEEFDDGEFDKLVRSADGPFAAKVELLAEADRQQIAEWSKQRDQLRATMPQPPQAMAVKEGRPENLRVHLRGSHLTLGAETPRRFPQILLRGEPAAIPGDVSGRLQLAKWLTRDEHPLTARVYVNRLWTWHFGAGLVRSPDNFGALGQRPTHPDLLDWLADELVRSGWSTKHVQRLILLSSTYRQSVRGAAELTAGDPENRLWGRARRRRLEAEAVRDSLLAISGTLDTRMGGTMLTIKNRAYVTSTANVNPDVYQSNRRSVYLPVVRSALYEVLQAFDFAEPSVISGQRQSTTAAPQALFMMNSEAVSAATRALAESLLEAESPAGDAQRMDRAFWRVLSRPPEDEERARMLSFREEYARRWSETHPKRAEEASWRSWQAVCRILLSSNEFMFRN